MNARPEPTAAVADPPEVGEPVVHLVGEDTMVADCGARIGSIVPYRAFSEHPCPACLKKRMEKKP